MGLHKDHWALSIFPISLKAGDDIRSIRMNRLTEIRQIKTFEDRLQMVCERFFAEFIARVWPPHGVLARNGHQLLQVGYGFVAHCISCG